MEVNGFKELKRSIENLKKQKIQLEKSLARDQELLKGVQGKRSKLEEKANGFSQKLLEKEEGLQKYDEIIDQSELALSKIINSTKMLINTLEQRTQA